MPYMMEGKCVYKKKADGSKGESMGCSETEEMAKKHMAALYANENKSLAEFSMVITKASVSGKDGAMRLLLTNSDVSKDAYEEEMSLELYEDFVRRSQNNEPVPEPFRELIELSEMGYWNGGPPYLSVSHFKSGGGENVPGEQESLYIDGTQLKSKDVLYDNELGRAVWKSVHNDLYEEKKKHPDKPIRVSIGFLDIKHKHKEANDDGSDFIFERKSLEDHCPLCDDKVKGKVYLSGHLVHKAFTRVPAHPKTNVEVFRMADEDVIKTQKDDAKSIIDDLADTLVGKSAIEDDALVIKAKAEKDLQSYAWDVKSAFYKEFLPPEPSMWISSVTDKSVVVYEDEKMYRVSYTDKNGEFSFDERSKWEEVMFGLIPVKSEATDEEWNIEFEKDKSETSEEVTMNEPKEVQVQEPVVETPAESNKSKIDLAVEKLKSKVAELRGKGNGALGELQPFFNELGEVVKAEVYNPAEAVAEVNRTTIREEINAAIPEIVAQILKSMPATQAAQPQVPANTIPQPRSLLVQRNALPAQGQEQMSQIAKLAYNSTVGYATGQRVE